MPPCPVRCGKSRRRVRARRRGALVCASCCPTLSIVRSTTSHREPACGFSSWRPDCVAGVVGLELRNVAINYPFERSHKFAGCSRIRATENCSRLSCAAGEMPLGPRAAGIFSKRCPPMLTIKRHRCKARIGPRFLPIRRCSAGGQTSNTIAHFALDFERKESGFSGGVVLGADGSCPV
jgi:hypothetical protein